jgi:hypothetical protein
LGVASPAEQQEAAALVERGIRASLRSTTSATYDSHVRGYVAYCAHFALTAWPASYRSLSAWFAYHVLKRGLSPHTLGNMLSAVRAHSVLAVASLPAGSFDTTKLDEQCLHLSPQEKGFLQRLQRGLLNLARRPVRHKLPVRRHMLDEAENAVRKQPAAGGVSVRNERGFLMLRVVQRLLLRVGEYTGEGTLLANDAESGEDFVRFSLRDTKTAAPGEVQTVELRDARLVGQLKELLATREPGEPLFQSVDKGKETGRAVTRCYVTELLREYLGLAGLNADAYSSHSLRAGGATDLAYAGARWPDLMRLGRWRSPATPLVYIAKADDFNLRLAKLMDGADADRGAEDSARPVAGPSLVPWRNEEEKRRFILEVRQQLAEEGAAGIAGALAAELEEIPSASVAVDAGALETKEWAAFPATEVTASPQPPSYSSSSASASSSSSSSSSAAAVPAKRSRVAARTVDALEDSRYEKYLWAKARYLDDLITSAAPGKRQQRRFVNAVENLCETVKVGLADALLRHDSTMTEKWGAELELSKQAFPFEPSSD